MSPWLDESHPPRKGEGLDLEKLEPCLCEHLLEMEEALEIEQFPSGFSDLTYLLRAGDLEPVLRFANLKERVGLLRRVGARTIERGAI